MQKVSETLRFSSVVMLELIPSGFKLYLHAVQITKLGEVIDIL